jgi:hypothetical protein
MKPWTIIVALLVSIIMCSMVEVPNAPVEFTVRLLVVGIVLWALNHKRKIV